MVAVVMESVLRYMTRVLALMATKVEIALKGYVRITRLGPVLLMV